MCFWNLFKKSRLPTPFGKYLFHLYVNKDLTDCISSFFLLHALEILRRRFWCRLWFNNKKTNVRRIFLKIACKQLTKFVNAMCQKKLNWYILYIYDSYIREVLDSPHVGYRKYMFLFAISKCRIHLQTFCRIDFTRVVFVLKRVLGA